MKSLKFRLVATKEDNPWLSSDWTIRNSIIKCNLHGPLPDWTPEEEAVFDATQMLRTLFWKIDQDGLS